MLVDLKYVLDVRNMSLRSPRHTVGLRVHTIRQCSTPDGEPYIEVEATTYGAGGIKETLRFYASACIIEYPNEEWRAWCERHCVMTRG